MKKRISGATAIVVATVMLFTSCGSDENIISAKEAKDAALNHAGISETQVTFVKSEPDYDDGRKIYDVEFYTGDFVEYDYEIDATTGNIVSFDSDAEGYSSTADNDTESVDGISEEEAKVIVLKKVPGSTEEDIREFRADYDDGKKEYEGKIIYNSIEYEFEIDADTGSITNWESESIFD